MVGFGRCWALWGVVLCFAVGCAGETLWLLEVSGLESPRVQWGGSLEFLGRGFPAGSVGELRLEGELFAAGQASHGVSLRLPAQARSAERVSVRLDEGAVGSIRGHASFVGRAVLRFPVKEGLSSAGALDPVAIEWADADGTAFGLRSAGQECAQGLGLEVSESSSPSGAVRVSELHQPGVAARAGLSVGDVIEAVDGLPARSVADLAPPSAARSLRLHLRDQLGVRRTVELSIEQGARWSLGRWFWLCPVALGSLFWGPWSAPMAWLRSGRQRLLALRVGLFRLPDAGGVRAHRVWIVLTALSCSLSTWRASRLTLAAAFALYVALLGLRFWPELSRLGWRASARVAGLCLGLALALGSGVVLSGGATLAALGAEQGASPAGWSLFARPPVWVAALLWLQCAGRLHGARSSARLELENSCRLILAATTAAVWLGGPSAPDLGLGPALQLGLCSVSLALKTIGVLYVLALLPLMAALSARRLALLAAAVAASTALWLWVVPERGLELQIGLSLLVTLALALVPAPWLGWMDRRRNPRAGALTSSL